MNFSIKINDKKNGKYILILFHILISLFIIIPYFYTSIKQAFSIKDLTDEQRKIKIYGNFYPSMMNYISQIPHTINAVMIEPPGKNAQFFWILNYYFLPRKIYAFPRYFLLDKELFDSLDIGFILTPQKTGFYFKKYHPSVPTILLVSPKNNDSLSSPPLFKWLPSGKKIYKIHICDAHEEKFTIKCSNQCLFPQQIWEEIPDKARIYWYVEEIDNHKVSNLNLIYKR